MTHNLIATNIVKNIPPSEACTKSSQFLKRKSKKLRGLVDRGTSKIVLKKDVPKTTTFSVADLYSQLKTLRRTIHSIRTDFFSQDHRDKDKNYLVKISTTVRQTLIKMLTTIALHTSTTFGVTTLHRHTYSPLRSLSVTSIYILSHHCTFPPKIFQASYVPHTACQMQVTTGTVP